MTAPPSLVVIPVVDYEPPARSLRTDPAVAPVKNTPPRERHLHAVPAVSPQRQAAAAFTDAALRSVLEVIDQRRPASQLRPLLVGGLADTVAALSRAHPDAKGQGRAAAVLRRVRLQSADADDTSFEVAAVYSRGTRIHALACRVELTATLRGPRWQLVALHLG
jgi:hypothetical protein